MNCSNLVKISLIVGGIGAYSPVTAGETPWTDPLETGADAPVLQVSEANWATGEGVSFGGILFPHFHANGALGVSTADEIERLAVGHHDPQTDVTLQALEPALSLRAGDYLEGFASYSAFTDAEGDIDGEWEEAFLKLKNLPGAFELRGGRFFNRFGFQNALHSHAWDFVNNNLLNGRILQEGELISDGVEITWNLPVPVRSALSFSFGVAPEHEEEEHGDGEEEAAFEEEGGRFIDEIFGAHFVNQFDYNDFHQQRLTLSGAWGDNEFGRTTQLYGIGYEYLWRQNGYEPGGRYFRWRSELAYRRFGAVSEEEEGEESRRDTFDETGAYSSLIYGLGDHTEAGLRVGYVSGVADLGADERWRISPNMTFSLNAQRTLYLRLQYDYDNSSDFGSEHSGWAQFGVNWGGTEVR